MGWVGRVAGFENRGSVCGVGRGVGGFENRGGAP